MRLLLFHLAAISAVVANPIVADNGFNVNAVVNDGVSGSRGLMLRTPYTSIPTEFQKPDGIPPKVLKVTKRDGDDTFPTADESYIAQADGSVDIPKAMKTEAQTYDDFICGGSNGFCCQVDTGTPYIMRHCGESITFFSFPPFPCPPHP